MIGAICRKKKQVSILTVMGTMGIVMLTGEILWILSLEGIVTGLWANMMSVIFTFLSVLYALLQWLAQLGEQRAVNIREPLSDASGSPVQSQRDSQTERLTSSIAFLSFAEIPSALLPLSSIIDSSSTTVLKRVSVVNGSEHKCSLSQIGMTIHIHIYHRDEKKQAYEALDSNVDKGNSI